MKHCRNCDRLAAAGSDLCADCREKAMTHCGSRQSFRDKRRKTKGKPPKRKPPKLTKATSVARLGVGVVDDATEWLEGEGKRREEERAARLEATKMQREEEKEEKKQRRRRRWLCREAAKAAAATTPATIVRKRLKRTTSCRDETVNRAC